MQNYQELIKEFESNVDTKALEKIASDLRLVMQDADARFVAAQDESEMDLVVKNFAMRKLNAKESEARKAVEKVAQIMSKHNHKNRIIFYYLVARELGSLSKIYE